MRLISITVANIEAKVVAPVLLLSHKLTKLLVAGIDPSVTKNTCKLRFQANPLRIYYNHVMFNVNPHRICSVLLLVIYYLSTQSYEANVMCL